MALSSEMTFKDIKIVIEITVRKNQIFTLFKILTHLNNQTPCLLTTSFTFQHKSNVGQAVRELIAKMPLGDKYRSSTVTIFSSLLLIIIHNKNKVNI